MFGLLIKKTNLLLLAKYIKDLHYTFEKEKLYSESDDKKLSSFRDALKKIILILDSDFYHKSFLFLYG